MDKLELNSQYIVELLCGVEQSVTVSTANTVTSGMASSLPLAPGND